MDHFSWNEGQCEICAVDVCEFELQQCHLGFCGTFMCQSCTQACASCRDGLNFGNPVLQFCTPCANRVVPRCFNCKERFCGQCTSFTKVNAMFTDFALPNAIFICLEHPISCFYYFLFPTFYITIVFIHRCFDTSAKTSWFEEVGAS